MGKRELSRNLLRGLGAGPRAYFFNSGSFGAAGFSA